MTEAVEERQMDNAPRARGQKLWAVLLVIDAFMVIGFGGALAAKIYQHWQAPAPNSPHARRGAKSAAAKAAPAKPAETAASTPAPAAAPTPPTTPPAAAAPAKPTAPAQPAPSKDTVRPPKPSLLHDAPLHEKPALQTSGFSPASQATSAGTTPGAKPKAVPTEFAIKAPGAKSVELAGAFLVHGGRKNMVSHPDGTWTVTLYLTPNTYRYWFLINGHKKIDPQNPNTERGASVLTVGQ